jgi:hypothetical protein
VREGDPAIEQAQRLMKAVDAILQDTAKNRGEAKKLPAEGDFLMKPLWTETREDREKKIRDLLDAAMGIITDVPVVDVQKKIEGLRKNIRELDDRIVKLREKQLIAPKDGMLPGYITDTVDSLSKDIEESKKRIEGNREEIAKAKSEIQTALNKAGIQLAPEQVDLLLDSVLSGDLVRLVAVFNSAKLIDGQLARLMSASGENIGAARKYFAMHAACSLCWCTRRTCWSARSTSSICRSCRPSSRTSAGPQQDGRAAARGESRGSESGCWRATAKARSWPRMPPRAIGATCCSSASRSPRRASAPRTT